MEVTGAHHALLLLEVDKGEAVLDEPRRQRDVELFGELSEDDLALGRCVRWRELMIIAEEEAPLCLVSRRHDGGGLRPLKANPCYGPR